MNRIKELRMSKGMNQKELAVALGIAQPTLSGWETGRSQIDYESLGRLKDYFGVSLDYLLCFSDNPTPDAPQQPVPSISPDIIALAEQIQGLPPSARALVEHQVKVLSDMDKK